LISNELPRFLDPSSAIASRFVVVETIKSFLGKEDRGLTAGLMQELSGIRRTSRARGLLFYRLLQQAAGTDPHPLSELIGGTGNDWDEPTDD
jgi:hypothetical protein